MQGDFANKFFVSPNDDTSQSEESSQSDSGSWAPVESDGSRANPVVAEVKPAVDESKVDPDAESIIEESKQLGRLANEFILKRKLGQGGFGRVDLAENKVDSALHAVKTVRFSPLSESNESRVLKEANIWAQLNHSNVVRYYSAWVEDASDAPEFPASGIQEEEEEEDSFTEGDEDSVPLPVFTHHLYIQMEYCKNSNLRSLIDEERLLGDHTTVWRIFGEVLEGLRYIHGKQLIHRDITPMNIFFDDHRTAKIGDFGLATLLSTSADQQPASQSRNLGTELYRAPELNGKCNANVRYNFEVDIYSLGVVLFEMFYRPLPLSQERLSTLGNLKKTKIVLPADFGEKFRKADRTQARRFITRMLSEEAGRRPTAEQILDRKPITSADEKHFQKIFERFMTKRSGRMYQWMIGVISREKSAAALNYCFDQLTCLDRINTGRIYELRIVCKEITDALSAKSFDLLEGLSSQNDSRHNFLRHCCRDKVSSKKCFSFDKDFVNIDSASGVHPCERPECSVDSIGPVSAALTLTADLLTTVGQLANTTLHGLKCTLRIGHLHVISAALRHLEIAEQQDHLVFEELRQLALSPKPLSTSEQAAGLTSTLGSGLASSLISHLPCAFSMDDLEMCCKPLILSRTDEIRRPVCDALHELRELSSKLTANMGENCAVDVLFDTTLVYRPDIFTDGIVFTLSVEAPQRKNAISVVVLGGGRYDSSLSGQNHPQNDISSFPLCLVGCSINLGVMARIREYVGIDWCEDTCPVVICTFTNENELPMSRLARKLLNRGITAEVLRDPVTSLNLLLNQCSSLDIDQILIVTGTDTVRHRTLKEEIEECTFDIIVEKLADLYAIEWDDCLPNFPTPWSLTRRQQMYAKIANPPVDVPKCSVLYAMSGNLRAIRKTRIQERIQTILPQICSTFRENLRVKVIVTGLSIELVKNITGSLTRRMKTDELNTLFEDLHREHEDDAQCLTRLHRHLSTFIPTSRGLVPAIVLFREDGFYRVIG